MQTNSKTVNPPLTGSCTDLAVGLRLGSLQPPHSLADGDLLQEGVALWRREVRRLHLAKVKLHSAVATDDMWEKGLAI